MARLAFFVVAAAIVALTSANDVNSHKMHATHAHYEVPEGVFMDMEPQESGGAGLGGHVVRTVLMLCLFLGMLSAFVTPHMSPVESTPMVESISEDAYELEDAITEALVEGCVTQDEELKQLEAEPEVEQEVVPDVVEAAVVAPQESNRAQKRAALLERAALVLQDRRTRSYDDIYKRLDSSTFVIMPGAKHAPAGFNHVLSDTDDDQSDSKDAPLLSTPSKLSASAAPYVVPAPKLAPVGCLLDSTGAPTPEFLKSVPATNHASSMMNFMPLVMVAAAGAVSPRKNIRRRKNKKKKNMDSKHRTAATESFNMHKKIDTPLLPRAASLPLNLPAAKPTGELASAVRPPSALEPSIWSSTPHIQSKVGRCPPGLSHPLMQQPLLPSGLLM